MGEPALDTVFQALADPTRRAILARLSTGALDVAELAAPLPMSQPAVSRHLKVLEGAGLIAVSVEGARRPRRLVPARLAEARHWLRDLEDRMEQTFARLEAVLDEMEDDR